MQALFDVSMKTFALKIFIINFLFSSSAVFAQKNKNEEINFSDDIASHRPTYSYQAPVFEGTPIRIEIIRNTENLALPDSLLTFKMDITKPLNKILDYVPEKVTVKISKPGFRVQVYVGKDREEASRIKGICLNMKKEEDAYLDYDRPNYRVKVGNFLNREDAKILYKELKRRFPEAMIVPDQVTVIKQATPDELILLRKKELEEKQKRGN
ncbi:MAG: hypothetical protein Fur0027_04470 [Raineya sp.]